MWTLLCSDAKPVYGCSWLGSGALGSFALMGVLRRDVVMVLWVYICPNTPNCTAKRVRGIESNYTSITLNFKSSRKKIALP